MSFLHESIPGLGKEKTESGAERPVLAPGETITVSDKAAAKIKGILESDGKSAAEYGFRLAVRGGGCSGYAYDMAVSQAKEGDKVYERDGVKVLVDPKSFFFLRGTVLDYRE